MTVDPIKNYEFFDFKLDVGNQELLKNDSHVPLTHKTFQVLELLVANAGHTTSKSEIFDKLWCDSFVEDSNLTQHIHVLRKILGNMPDGRSYVETVPRFGYRFGLNRDEISVELADREPESDLSGWANAPEPAASEINSTPDVRDGRLRRFRKSASGFFSSETRQRSVGMRTTLALAAPLIMAAAAAPAFYYLQTSMPKTQLASAAPIKSIAVMPFKPIGERVDKEKLGFGMTDAVITNLSRIKNVAVRSTSAVSRYAAETSPDASTAGRALAVDGVLEGIVQCDGESLRVSVQLIRVEDGKPMWAESFHEKISDNFSMQDSISSKVAQSLSNNLAQPEIVAHSPFSEVPDPNASETNE